VTEVDDCANQEGCAVKNAHPVPHRRKVQKNCGPLVTQKITSENKPAKKFNPVTFSEIIIQKMAFFYHINFTIFERLSDFPLPPPFSLPVPTLPISSLPPLPSTKTRPIP
jgi:hypothetical protein